jgi:hypothetical protein
MSAPAPFPFVPVEVLQNAEDACADSRARFAAGDRTVTDPEDAAYRALLVAAKAAGVRDPLAELVVQSMPVQIKSWASRGSPLAGRRISPIAK